MTTKTPLEGLQNSLNLLTKTEPRLKKLPPAHFIAKGHEEYVYLYITEINDGPSTFEVLMKYIRVKEIQIVTQYLIKTQGLIYKKFSMQLADKIRSELNLIDTSVILIDADKIEEFLKYSS